MPTVPYSPVPNVSPTEAGTPSVSVNAPAAAFGGTVGQALEHLGQVESHVGDEIFKRAIALQELQNETAAKEQDAQYMMKVGQLHADFSALQGQQAIAAYPKYMQDIQTLRTKMRNELPNDSARKMYDSSSLSTMGRTIFNGAGHAATQQKIAANGASVARVDAILNDIYQNPQDEVGYTRGINAASAEIHSQGDLHGWSKEQTQSQVSKVISKALAHRITGLSKTAPFEAQELFEDNKKQLHGDDIDRVENTVRMATRNTGARVEAVKLTDYMNEPRKEGEAEKSEAVLVKEARERAREIAPNDSLFGQALEQQVIAIYNRNKRIEKDTENRNMEDINSGIMGAFSGGKVPANIDELKAVNPRTSAAVDSMPPHKQIEIPGRINRYNKAVNQQSQQEKATELTGMAINDPEGFLNLDITQQPLSQQDMQKFMKLQDSKRKNAAADPRVAKAVGWLRGAIGSQMEALGIFKRTDSNKEEYDHFVGTLQSAIEVWQETNKKPPSYDDITKTIGPQVIRQTREPSLLFGDWWKRTSDPFFKQTVPSGWGEALKEDIFNRTSEQLSDEQVYKAYLRSQYIKLYGKKEKPSGVGSQ